MNKLQEIKDKFETKTVGGHDVEILSYKEGQEHSIIGIWCIGGEWDAITWTEDGQYDVSNFVTTPNLVLKKKPLPKDILCEVWDTGSEGRKFLRYSSGKGDFFNDGATSNSTEHGFTHSVDNYKVLEQDTKPWFNDAECPIPEGLNHRVFVGGCWYSSDGKGWNWSNAVPTITSYQILGELE